MKLLVLSHLHYFLHIPDHAGIVIARRICYDLNLLDIGLTNILELNVKSGILANTTNIWINIDKTILTRDQTDEKIEFNNYTNFVYHSDKPTALQNELIPIINKGYLSKSKSHQTLKELLLNSDSKKFVIRST